jgi:secreted PhoX family phosphatase
MKKLITVAACAAAIVSSVSADDLGNKTPDFGQAVEQLAKALSPVLYGTLGTLRESSTASLSAADADMNPAKLLTVAPGLKVKALSSDPLLAPNIDQMFLWPRGNHPTHIIACNEQGSGQVAVQRVNITTGAVANIISSGMTNCDPARLTPWGTVIVGEENGINGRLFEILDPLNTTNVTVPSSGFGATSDPAHVIARPALGQFSFEGIGILPNGIVYLTDENRPGAGGIGNPGGAIVKFIPQVLWVAGSPAITNLSQSPWTAGRLFGMRIGRNSNNTDVGQGNEFGRGVWVEITGTQPINLRAAANTLKLTSYYRPEDMSIDSKQLAAGKVRFCGTNTGQDTPDTMTNGDNHWGEVYCITDGTVAAGEAINTVLQGADTINTSTVPEYQPLVIGNLDLAMPDNVDIQPGTGNFLLNEDGDGALYSPPRNNDIWACLDDGDDADQLADNCARLMSLNDLTAEPTGGFFDATGTRYFVSIQHNITGHGVILEVDGWKVRTDR